MPLSEGSLWIACRLEVHARRWQVVRVRTDVPEPPSGIERRGVDRLTLEMGGLLLGAFEQMWMTEDQATVYLCTASTALETCLDHVRGADGLTTGVRARLLAGLAGVADAIEGAMRAA